MRKPLIALHIPSPCTQSWAAMTPQGMGRHCAACQKVVIDFTQKTDAEILAVLASAGSHACGRFGASQLNRSLQPLPEPRSAAWWQTALAATVALLSFRSLDPEAALGQASSSIEARPQVPATPHFMARPAEVEQSVADDRISGRVLDKQTGEGLPGVTVLVVGTTHGVSTNADGTFVLDIFPEDRQRPLLFSSIGYLRQTLALPAGQQNLTISLDMDTQAMSGMVMVGAIVSHPIYTPRGVWSRLRSIPWRVKNALHRE